MKLTRNNNALHLLNEMKMGAFRVVSDDDATTMDEKTRMVESIVRIWPNISPKFSKKKQYLTKPFYEAYERAASKLVSVLDKEDIDESGTFIYQASDSEVNTIFYWLQTKGKDKDFDMDATIMIFTSHTKKDKSALGLLCQRRFGMPAGGARFYCSTPGEKAKTTPTTMMADIFTLILFLKYCELETKIIRAGKKDKHIGIKYVNDTSQDVQILDSSWFTTIVRSDGFHVRGHFRFQPCGQGMKDRKLIWIADYDKDGYTRTAKILNQTQ